MERFISMAVVLLFRHTNIAAVKSCLNVFEKLYWAVRYIVYLADETKLFLSLSTKQRRNPCSVPSTCVPRFEYAPWLPCLKKKTTTTTTSICQSGWKEVWNAFPGIHWVFLFVKYIRLQYTVQWNKQKNKQRKWQRAVDAHDKDF